MVKTTSTTHICRRLTHFALSSPTLFSFFFALLSFSFSSCLSLSFRYPQDYVTVYDGYTTRDPIILKFCGGGQAVPAAVSSGPELLVEFSTSPFGTFTGTSSQVLPLYGFQLEVSGSPVAKWQGTLLGKMLDFVFPFAGRSSIRGHPESHVLEKQETLRVLDSRCRSWHPRESQALAGSQFHVPVSPPRAGRLQDL